MIKQTGNIEFVRSIFQKKIAKDSLWLLASQVVLAVFGIFLNIIITKYFGIATFGTFSIAIKTYLIVSIFSTFGVGVSALKFSAQYADQRAMLDKSMSAALVVVLISSMLVILVLFFAMPLFSMAFSNISLNDLLEVFFIAIPFYSLNKVLSLILNGQRDIKAVSVIQISRWLLLISLISISIFVLQKDLTFVLLAFPVTELIILSGAWLYCKKYFSFSFSADKNWIKEHFVFGGKSMLFTAFTDLNNYLDVFLIGFFCGSKSVGVFSFAADAAKNLVVIADIVLTSLNPIISQLFHQNRLEELRGTIRKIRNITYLIYIPLCIGAVLVYVLLVNWLGVGLSESMVPFLVLTSGVFLFSGIRPFISILEFAGFPGEKLKLSVFVMLINFILLVLFINVWGVVGAALAFVFTNLISAILLNWLSVKKLDISLFALRS